MMREALDVGSKHVFLRVNARTNVVFRRRLADEDYSVETSYPGRNCSWLRLLRMGNTFVGYCSTNGTNWQYVWFTTVNMSNQVRVGLAVTAHHQSWVATGRFDNVSIGAVTPLPGVWPLPGPKFLLGGEPDGMAELQRVGGFKVLLGGTVGEHYTLKATADLSLPFASWPVLATVTNIYGVVEFCDLRAITTLTTKPQFYRVVVAP